MAYSMMGYNDIQDTHILSSIVVLLPSTIGVCG